MGSIYARHHATVIQWVTRQVIVGVMIIKQVEVILAAPPLVDFDRYGKRGRIAFQAGNILIL
ncbi:hypothetical protein D9M69_733820 [compost metagenome]